MGEAFPELSRGQAHAEKVLLQEAKQLRLETARSRRLALLTQAFMPAASGKILDQLVVPAERRTLDFYPSEKGRLEPGTELPKPAGVFPRYVDEAAA